MKKLSVCFLMVMATILAVGCMGGFTFEGNCILREDLGSLNVAVVMFSHTKEDETGESKEVNACEIQVSVKNASLFVADHLNSALNSIVSVEYRGSFKPVSMRAEEDYTTFAFYTEIDEYVTHVDSSYGFFDIEHRYVVIPPAFFGQLKDKLYNILSSNFSYQGKEYQPLQYLGKEARFSLCFVSTSDLEGEGVYKVYRTVYSLGVENVNETVGWLDAPDSFAIKRKAMASGWYIFPIMIGIAAFAIAYFVGKHRDKKITAMEEEAISSVFVELDEKKDEIINGQVSMEEYEKYIDASE